MVLDQMALAEEQPANQILGGDKIGFIFLDCRGNTPEGEGGGEVRTLEPHCNSREEQFKGNSVPCQALLIRLGPSHWVLANKPRLDH